MKKLSPKELWVWGVFAGLHTAAVTGLVLSQGCQMPRPAAVEPPPAPVMPPPAVPEPPPAVLPPPGPVPPAVQRPAVPPLADVTPTEYVVQPGDSLSKIAARHGVSTRELAELNNIADPNKLRIGQKLLLPGHAGRPRMEKPTSAPRAPSVSGAVGADEYVVQPGDSLSKIAARHGVSTRELAELNKITDLNKLRAGQKLKLPSAAKASPSVPAVHRDTPPTPSPSPVSPPATEPSMPAPQLTAPSAPVTAAPSPAPTPTLGSIGQPIRYPVSAGETLDSIAKIFLVTPESILKLNNLPDAAAVKPGMTLLIPISQ